MPSRPVSGKLTVLEPAQFRRERNRKDRHMAEQKEDGAPKRKKMNSLDLAEIEAELVTCQEKQGGLVSKYALQLLARKKTLSG